MKKTIILCVDILFLCSFTGLSFLTCISCKSDEECAQEIIAKDKQRWNEMVEYCLDQCTPPKIGTPSFLCECDEDDFECDCD